MLVGIIIFKNYKFFAHVWGFWHTVLLDFLHQSTRIFLIQVSRLFIFYLSSSLFICDAGALSKDLTVALQLSYILSLSLSGSMSLSIVFHIMSLCQYFIKKEEDIIPSLYAAVQLLSPHC